MKKKACKLPTIIGRGDKQILIGWSKAPVRDRINLVIYDDNKSPNELVEDFDGKALGSLRCWIHFTNPKVMHELADLIHEWAYHWDDYLENMADDMDGRRIDKQTGE